MDMLEIFENSPIGISITSLKTEKRLWVNRRLVEMFAATSKRQMSEVKLVDYWVDPMDYFRLVKAIGRGDLVREWEVERKRMDGSTWWSLITAQLTEFQGHPARIVWHNEISQQKLIQEELEESKQNLEQRVIERTQKLTAKIADRQRAEVSLRKNEEKFRGVFNLSAIGMAMFSPGGKFIEVNEAFTRVFGYTAVEILTKDWEDVSLLDDIPMTLKKYAEAKKEKSKYLKMDKRLIRKNGQIIWGHVVSAILRDENGDIEFTISQYQDITEIRNSHQQLKKAHQKFKSVFGGSAVGKALETANGTIMEVNEAFTKIFGYSQDEIKNKNWRDISHPDDLDVTQNQIDKISSGRRQNIRAVKRYFRKDGEVIWVRLSTAVLRDSDGKIDFVVSQYEDVTELKNAEIALQESNRRFKDFAEIAADWFWETDATGAYSYLSDGYTKTTGTSLDKVLGKTSNQLFTLFKETMDEEMDSWDALSETIQRREAYDNFTYSRIGDDGKRVVLRCGGRPVYDKDGIFKGYRGTGQDITDIIDSEHTARMVHEAVETYPDAIILIGTDDRILFTNERYHHVFPHIPPARKIVNHKLIDLFRMSLKAGTVADSLAPSDPEAWISGRFEKHQNQTEGGGETTHTNGKTYSYRFRQTKDGGRIHVFTDITELKKANQKIVAQRDQLVASHSRFKDFAEIAADWFWETDENDAFIYLSEGYEKVVGTKTSDVLGKTRTELAKFFKGQDNEKLDSWDQQLERIKNREPFENFTYNRIRPSGKDLVVRSSGKPVYDINGRYLGYRGTGTDISDLVDKERTARMVREAVETYPDAIILIGADKKVLFTNDRYHAFSPHLPPADEIQNYKLHDLFRMSIKAGVINQPLARVDPDAWIAQRFEEQEKRAEGTGESVAKNGRTYSFRYRRTKDGGLIYAHTDITVLKNATEEIAARRDELAELNKQKDRFFTIVAHDLKSPFTSLLGMSQLLESRADSLSKEQVVTYSALIHRSAEGAFKLLEDLLDWSRVQLDRLDFEPMSVDLNEPVKLNIERYQSLAEAKKIKIINKTEQPCTTYADKGMVATIMRNLVSNAIKFTAEGGEISIATKTHKDRVEMTVTDNGTGIPSHIIGNLFAADVKTTISGTGGETGTGLGLPLCMELAKKQGGDIEIESIVGEGTVFRVLLPANREKHRDTTKPLKQAAG